MRCRGLIALLIWGQSVAAADLGTWGDLWPVKEPDMLTVIMQRLTALEPVSYTHLRAHET